MYQRKSLVSWLVLVATLAMLGGAIAAPTTAQAPATVIRGATVVDGTGGPGAAMTVRIVGDRIAAVGEDAERAASSEDRVIEAEGLVLAPGFIDTHSHHDRGLAQHLEATAAISQGITTVVVGQDGGSNFPLERFFARLDDQPAAVNVASYAGHGTLRRQVLGEDFRRAASTHEIESMRQLFEKELRAGALGLGTGLEYDPGIYATKDEVVALAQMAAQHNGRYISHMRSEDRYLLAAVDELIEIGRRAQIPVQASHLKLAMKSLWGRAPELIAKLDRARAEGIEVSADVYPYEYWQSTMTVLFPERDFTDREAASFALEELAPPDGIVLSHYAPDRSLVGQSLAQIASDRRTEPVELLLQLISESLAWTEKTGQPAEMIIARSMSPKDIADLYRWPHTNVSSDGMLDDRHPRGAGSFPRVLAQQVRATGALSLEQAIHKMTALSAKNVGLLSGAGGRGIITKGAFADLVLFDPATVADRATPEHPERTATGIVRVWVNGEAVWDRGAATGRRPGRALRRPGVASPHDPQVIARIDEVLNEAGYGGTDAPGCALGVTQDGEPVLMRGYGMAVLESHEAISPQSVFRIGSVSKQFAAAVVALLHQRGVLSLDAPVRTYLPELPDYSLAGENPVTLRHLIHHSSGMRDYLTLMSLAGRRDDDFYSEDEALAMIARQRELNFPPGSEFLYSNSGYFLVSQIVERVTGQSLREVADELLFSKLEMHHTHFHDDHTHVVPQRALGYAPAPGPGFRQSMTTLDMVGDGGVFTSVEDMARWLRELHTSEILGKEFHELIRNRGLLISPGAESEQREDASIGDYAFGLLHGEYRGLRTLGHGGAFVGYRADLETFPDQALGLVVLCNSSAANPGAISRRVVDVLLEAELGPRAEQEGREPERLGTTVGRSEALEAGDAGTATEFPAKNWLGSWYAPELEAMYTLEQEGDLLKVMAPPGLELELRLVSSSDSTPAPTDGQISYGDGFFLLRAEAPPRRGRAPGVLRLDAGRVNNLRLERARQAEDQ